MGDFEGVVTLGVAKASKPIFPIRGGEVFESGWPLRKSDGRSAGRSESRTVAPLAAQKSDVGGFRGGGNPGRGISLKTDFPY